MHEFIHICVKQVYLLHLILEAELLFTKRSMARTLTDAQITEQATRLDKAEQNKQQIKPGSAYYPDISIEDAYLIQDAWIQTKIERGRKIVGHKVGLTSRAMQKVMSINESDFGVLLDDMVFTNRAEIKASDFLDPKIEVEVAFKLAKDLDPVSLTIDGVLEASEYIVPSLELIAARSYRKDPESGYTRNVKDTISDNAANAGIIIGNTHISKSADLKWVGAVLRKNGIIEESGIAGAVLEHPANGVIWLAEKYAEIGRILKAGQIILAGSFTRPVSVNKGDEIVADFNEFGTVGCKFV